MFDAAGCEAEQQDIAYGDGIDDFHRPTLQNFASREM